MPLVGARRLEIPDVILFEYKIFEDERGFFTELWKRGEYLAAGLPYDFVQVNLSYSRPYVVRGLHYQLKPSEQGKLVTVVRGRVFDVAVDIRRGSPWFGRYVAVELVPGRALWIPPGFAHGFQALEETLLLYLVTKEFDPQRDRCAKWDDPALGIRWPAPEKAILSQKDRNCPPLAEAENNFEYSS
ncbi:dTDP-4-dehydrorhamnose 3,5-epimerase [Pyrobaculum sp. 3827-6]|uniref:dTDP-4-dehydrorhamnose 3,5-epimerase n=1 Tax=Pyrobaculum sp. 3827-6 TaxID=2983604 RepID=UPI0021D940EA|nr:dTDP-4-dehydrorhamnose 3,5-epimerase [Pyrobaculum sp. 3827-6]MCU7787759.1 dTDP-4-dehydrorhamnose 3,5-epimerase [Pyrobaculum sp. 3827-6]